MKHNLSMRILFSILFFFIFQLSALSNVAEYIDSYTKCSENQSYKSFSQIIKGEASISDIEKQMILDKEISDELNSPFVYTDLEECIKIALDKNYDIQISDAGRLESYWLNKNAYFQLLPDAYYDFNISNLGGSFLVGGIVATTVHEVPIQSIFGVEWSTINQGKYFFYLAQTKNLLKSSSASLEYTKDEILLNTVLAYYDLLGIKMELEVQMVNLYDRLEQLKYTQARFDAGLGTLYDVKRAQAEFAGAQLEYTTTINSLRLAQASLANILGIDICIYLIR